VSGANQKHLVAETRPNVDVDYLKDFVVAIIIASVKSATTDLAV